MGDAWGIEAGYWDIAGQWHDTPGATRRALRAAMGGLSDVDDAPPASRPVWFVRHGSGPAVQRPADVVLEDGTLVDVGAALPADLPLGYHDLHPADGGPTTRLIVVPDRCAPAPERAWGWSVQLYAARSRASWGIGDVGDLATLGRLAARQGAGFLVLSPLHAPMPGPSPEPSPYFASSRRWRNPLHLRIEDVPGFDPGDDELAALAAKGRQLNGARVIDRDAVWARKRAALDLLWRGGDSPGPPFRAWRAVRGASLQRYATFCALAEHHGSGWRSWPPEHRRPDAPGVARFAAEHADAVAFHAWLQWLLDRQLAAAAHGSAGFVHDLAIGADPDGADAWVWQDTLASGVRVGAPADEFNADGQDWGLPPFIPWRLRAAGYEPLAELLRGAFERGSGLRVDHVMGFSRLWCIPPGAASAADGGYVRFPGTELLDVLALESVRAGTFVVGEDLGTVEDEVRAALAERDVLSYRLAWFEPDPPERWPEQALGALTTHDLPTLAGVRGGTDDPGGDLRHRLAELLGGPIPDDGVLAAAATHRRLAAAPCRLVSATLEDALGVEERPNVPGTTTERPNWSIALPVAVDELAAHDGVQAVADAISEGRRSPD
jgi:4-alpha-glucanotransferase